MNNKLSSKVKQFLSGSITGLERFAQRNANAYQSLLQDLKGNNLIPFWGAGFVAGLFPTWSALLEEIAEEWDINLSLATKQSNTKEATEEDKAEYLLKEIGEETLHRELIRIFSQPRRELSSSRSRAREIFRSYHITTNYDKTIENLSVKGMPPLKVVLPQDLQRKKELASLIQQNKHSIIKLHGDIEDSKRLILSQRSYNIYYPSQKNDSTVQQVLSAILASTPVIFIGSSLERDRTLSIVRRYAKQGCRFYALLSLPESTVNKNDPYMPLIREGQGHTDYLKQQKSLAALNVTPIWYPYGEHGFVDGFLDLLHGEVVAPIAKPNEYKKIDFLPDEAYKGREQEKRALYQTLESGRIAWVSGGPGIGKSQLCHQVMARRQAENSARVYLTVDCQELSSLEALYLSCILACNPKADKEAVQKSGEALRTQALRLCAEVGSLGLLIDNFEMLNDAACKGAFSPEMIEFFYDLHGQGVELIMASRYSDMQCHELSPSRARFRAQRDQIAVYPLSDAEARALFEYHVEGDLVCEGDDFEQLLSLMEGHPMSIMLVAGLCEENMTWGFLLQDFKNNAGKETTVTTSCCRAWTLLQENERARTLWGVLAWSTQPMPVSWIFDKGDEAQQWNAALARLTRLNLVSVQDDQVTMLMPIKQEFHKMELAGEGEPFNQSRAEWWVERIDSLATGAFNVELVRHLSEVLQVMMKLLQVCNVEDIVRLCEELRRYYSSDLVASKEYLDALFAVSSEMGRLRAAARIGLGICCYFRNQYDEAICLFQEAGEFYSSVDDRCYAYCLWRMGDAERFRDRYDEAIAFIRLAERLYIKVKDHLGLAQSLKSMGDVARMRHQYSKANSLYQRAEHLYVQVEDHLGLAQTLSSMGDMARMCNQYDKAVTLYERAELLYAQVEDNRGLAQTLWSMGDVARMCNQYDKAVALFERAELLYIQVESNLGLAWTLSSMGDVARMREQYDKAVKLYKQAEHLYVLVQSNLGLAYVLLNQGQVCYIQDQSNMALEYYDKAEVIFVAVGDLAKLAAPCFGWMLEASSRRVATPYRDRELARGG